MRHLLTSRAASHGGRHGLLLLSRIPPHPPQLACAAGVSWPPGVPFLPARTTPRPGPGAARSPIARPGDLARAAAAASSPPSAEAVGGSGGSGGGGAGQHQPGPPVSAPRPPSAPVVEVASLSAQALSNRAGMQLLFLGTGCGPPTPDCNGPALAVRTLRGAWLFDAGEDTQRALGRTPLVRAGRLDAAFLSGAAASNVGGLPGMLCIASAARDAEGGSGSGAACPLYIFGPPGVAEYLDRMLLLSDTFMAMPVHVHEFTPPPPPSPADADARGGWWDDGGAERPSDDGGALPARAPLARRARLTLSRLRPDVLNPAGYYNLSPAANAEANGVPAADRRPRFKIRGRAPGATAATGRGNDPRCDTRPLVLPAGGKVDAVIDPATTPVTWTLRFAEDLAVRAVLLGGGGEDGPSSSSSTPPRLAFTVTEADRAGRLDFEAALAAGVPPGPAMGQLKAGLSVTTADGTEVHPSSFVAPDVPGRVVAIVSDATGLASPADVGLQAAVGGADLVVAGVGGGAPTAASVAGLVGEAAAAAGVGEVVLTRLPPARAVREGAAAAAGATFGRPVRVAADLAAFDIGRKVLEGEE